MGFATGFDAHTTHWLSPPSTLLHWIVLGWAHVVHRERLIRSASYDIMVESDIYDGRESRGRSQTPDIVNKNHSIPQEDKVSFRNDVAFAALVLSLSPGTRSLTTSELAEEWTFGVQEHPQQCVVYSGSE
ncbi:hypothetical protein NA57DRAFT_55155 [Rhizodiscina lignyota]|uniref:Uncharacterized protein n=1 Tax=Rhizodiscina lignyota TaxID=1504668 RepID=A0A9P4IK13_9PEZI|nr:hypothetical protein NA57DRAFT_55155 [Rhizodiscina lignyota]